MARQPTSAKLKKILDWLIRGKDGKVYLAQLPNLPIAGWFTCVLIAHFLARGAAKTGFVHLSFAFLAIWSYLEITQGASRFRRVLGAIVALAMGYGVFK